MFNLIDEGGVYAVYAQISYKRIEKGVEDFLIVFDPGCAITIIDTTITDNRLW